MIRASSDQRTWDGANLCREPIVVVAAWREVFSITALRKSSNKIATSAKQQCLSHPERASPRWRTKWAEIRDISEASALRYSCRETTCLLVWEANAFKQHKKMAVSERVACCQSAGNRVCWKRRAAGLCEFQCCWLKAPTKLLGFCWRGRPAQTVFPSARVVAENGTVLAVLGYFVPNPS
jgi:hypothetical protein